MSARRPSPTFEDALTVVRNVIKSTEMLLTLSDSPTWKSIVTEQLGAQRTILNALECLRRLRDE